MKVSNLKLFAAELIPKLNLMADALRLLHISEQEKGEILGRCRNFVCRATCPSCKRLCGCEEKDHKAH